MDEHTTALAYIVVHDVAASWTTYPSCGLRLDGGPVPGLLLHAAGPTDEGFRTIDVWRSRADDERHRRLHADRWPAGLAVPPVVRSLEVLHLVTKRPRQDSNLRRTV